VGHGKGGGSHDRRWEHGRLRGHSSVCRLRATWAVLGGLNFFSTLLDSTPNKDNFGFLHPVNILILHCVVNHLKCKEKANSQIIDHLPFFKLYLYKIFYFVDL